MDIERFRQARRGRTTKLPGQAKVEGLCEPLKMRTDDDNIHLYLLIIMLERNSDPGQSAKKAQEAY